MLSLQSTGQSATHGRFSIRSTLYPSLTCVGSTSILAESHRSIPFVDFQQTTVVGSGGLDPPPLAGEATRSGSVGRAARR
jgi:hypothetical protein